VEAVTALDIRRSGQADYVSILEQLANFEPASGLLLFTKILGTYRDLVRVTFTGGYWWDTWDTGDDGSADTLPEGATALPEDLFTAWTLQVQDSMQKMDLLNAGGSRHVEDKAKEMTLLDLQLLPQVQNILRSYIRHG